MYRDESSIMLENPAEFNFRPSATSPLRRAGVSAFYYARDMQLAIIDLDMTC